MSDYIDRTCERHAAKEQEANDFYNAWRDKCPKCHHEAAAVKWADPKERMARIDATARDIYTRMIVSNHAAKMKDDVADSCYRYAETLELARARYIENNK